MAIKLYTDEHIVPVVVSALRKQGIDVFTAQEAAMLNTSDEEHLQFSTSQGRAIVTQDALVCIQNNQNIAESFMPIKEHQ